MAGNLAWRGPMVAWKPIWRSGGNRNFRNR